MSADKENAEQKTSRRIVGRVVSNKMNKSVTVSVERLVKHPVYGKYIRRTTKIVAHDEANECKEGDVVAISECRPISKTKAWRVVEIVSAQAAG
ncbi:MAG TPA: 30S ribosomal protein S17 [Gammaproteobacteria bacterium]|jgi:small subunit ribosomal protein S17|nr:30S ribosomal protein S17 [Gammaproteobacteria bacterium]